MSISLIIIALIGLILLSGFFSGSETSMMSLNRYRLRHLAIKDKNKSAKRIQGLLKRPDRLLGMILIGNTFANILASSLTTVIAEEIFGKYGVFISTIILTVIILIFAEIIPKTIANLYPEKFAFPVALPLSILLTITYPIVWIIGNSANFILSLINIRVKKKGHIDPLSKEEIHTVVSESGDILTKKYKNMLLGVLELDSITVADVMIPRGKVEAIDISSSTDLIDLIIQSKHTTLLVYDKELDNILGILPVKNALKFINISMKPQKKDIVDLIIEPYYIPEGVSLQKQLINFQKKGSRFAVVVDEYGSIEGIVTVEDILEEIVGEFSDTFDIKQELKTEKDGCLIVSGSITLRELNRHTNFELVSNSASTLSGFIIENLELIPDGPCALKYDNFNIEITKMNKNMITEARICPKK